MTLAIAIEKRLESEIARALKNMGHVRDRPEGLNEADTQGRLHRPDPERSRLGAARPFFRLPAVPSQTPRQPRRKALDAPGAASNDKAQGKKASK
jgi:hypothetical protein